MIILHRGLLAAAHLLILLLFRGRVDAHRWGERQETSSTRVPAPSSTVGANDPTAPLAYFQTQWRPFDSPYALYSPFEISYKVISSNSIITQQGDLVLYLLWTSARSGTPAATNTYGIAHFNYICDIDISVESHCTYLENSHGTANLNLTLNPAQSFPPTADGIVKNFFFCFATKVDSIMESFVCESYSQFFDVNVTSSNGLKRRAQGDPQVPLGTPSAPLSVTLSTGFIFPTSPPNPTQAPIFSPTIAAMGPPTLSILLTQSIGPTGTTTIQPSDTGTPAPASNPVSKSSKDGLPIGAIIGIAIGGFIILLVALLVAFFCYRRRNRIKAQGTPEQVLLTHNMHNGSRDLMAEKPSPTEMPLFGSVLETRPSSGPYDHLAMSAPYNGPLGPGRLSQLPSPSLQRISVPQRNPTSATVNTMNTNVSNMSNLSRGMSDASGPIMGRDFNDPYSDVPVYGDARHMPQVYQGNLQAPFLSEPGMTDEELTRLEEEERRIDAAILEAERRL